MSNPLQKISRAKKIKHSNTEYGRFELKHNDLKIFGKEDSYLLLEVHEICKNEDVEFHELVVIDSKLSNGDCAIVGSECKSNEVEEMQKTDILYLFVSNQQNTENHCYAYEIKHRVGNSEKIIIEMIGQWADTCFFCKYLYELAYRGIEPPCSSNLRCHVGVITESFEKNTLLNNWIEPKKQSLITTKPQNFFEQKLQAQQSETEKKLKILQDFYNGQAIINGTILPFDVRIFDNQRKVLHFVDGILQ